jgi:hypothetical protein
MALELRDGRYEAILMIEVKRLSCIDIGYTIGITTPP